MAKRTDNDLNGVGVEFQLPQNPAEWLPWVAPLLTFLVGLGYFIFPALILRHVSIDNSDPHPEAIGEGRASFAAFMIGLPIICILFQQPILDLALLLSWIVVVAGKLLHILTGGLRHKAWSVLLRFLIALAITGFAWNTVFGMAGPVFDENIWHLPVKPEGLSQILPTIGAAIMLLFGLISFLAPGAALTIMRLRAAENKPGAKGEIRGTLAGFYSGIAILLLMNPDVSFGPSQFLGIAFALGWVLTAFGRLITMLSDWANNLFNWISLLFEIGMACLTVLVILQIVV